MTRLEFSSADAIAHEKSDRGTRLRCPLDSERPGAGTLPRQLGALGGDRNNPGGFFSTGLVVTLRNLVRSFSTPLGPSLVFLSLVAIPLRMTAASWLASPANGDWNTAANWAGAAVPSSAADTAIFGISGITAVSLPVSTSVGGLTFEAGASAYMLTVAPKATLTLSGAGVINRSNANQQLILAADGYRSNGQITFGNDASAGNIDYLSQGGADSGASGGQILFAERATAGSATFTNAGGAASNAYGASIVFKDSATAANSRITNRGGTRYLSSNSFTYFLGHSSAGNCTITNEAHVGLYAGGGTTLIEDDATADGCTLIAKGSGDGMGGGSIIFAGNATGGHATIKVYNDGMLFIGNHNAPGVTIGSLEGTGGVNLGANTLTVGSSNLNSAFGGSLLGWNGSLAKIGSGTFTLSGQSSYTGGTTISAGSIVVNNTSGSALGSGAVTVAPGATLGGAGIVGGVTTVAGGAHLSPGSPTGPLTFSAGLTLQRGAILEFELGTTSDQIVANGGSLVGPSGIGGIILNLSNAGGFVSGVPYTLIKFAGAQTADLDTTDFTINTPVGNTSAADYSITMVDHALVLTYTAPLSSRLVNISTRAFCATNDNVTIGGFVVAGSARKRVLIRAVGPSLTAHGIGAAEVLADPVIELHHGSDPVVTNDNWLANANASEITSTAATLGAFTLLASDATSSALLLSLDPGVYTFVVKGKNDTSGIVLLEVYDADTATPTANFVNISSRASATTGNGVAVGGFVIVGNAPKRILLRALGPTLAANGLPAGLVLANPVIELHHGNDPVITNDNWGANANSAEIRTTAARLGATPIDTSDTASSALLLTLAPGAYSFIAQGQGATSGIVLVEVYDAD